MKDKLVFNILMRVPARMRGVFIVTVNIRVRLDHVGPSYAVGWTFLEGPLPNSPSEIIVVARDERLNLDEHIETKRPAFLLRYVTFPPVAVSWIPLR